MRSVKAFHTEVGTAVNLLQYIRRIAALVAGEVTAMAAMEEDGADMAQVVMLMAATEVGEVPVCTEEVDMVDGAELMEVVSLAMEEQ